MDENKLIEILRDYVTQVNIVNKRTVVVLLAMAIAFTVCVCAFCLRDSKIAHDYFTQDYNYATYTNSNYAGDNATQTNKMTNGDDAYDEAVKAN